MATPFPADLRDAVVRVCGDAFHYYATLKPVFVAAGISGEFFDSLRADSTSKYVLCRRILAELDTRGEAGRRMQVAVVQQLLSIREPMPDAPDAQKGRQALADLRRLAKDGRLPGAALDEEPSAVAARRKRRELQEAARKEAATRKAALQARFTDMTTARGRSALQRRGYDFEDFLRDLFVFEDIVYRKSYRVASVEQIDGAFSLAGHEYLVEAKWQADPPTLGDLLVLAGKLETKFTDTRGFFITFVPPRQEVVDQLAQMSKKMLIMDGADLAVILEGRLSLRDALELKLRKANHEGVIFHPLTAPGMGPPH